MGLISPNKRRNFPRGVLSYARGSFFRGKRAGFL